MFNKLKLRKAPLSLSSVSNAIKNSGSASLSPEVTAKHLKVLCGDQLGLPLDAALAAAYDPVQSLLAISTRRGTVHVYGQHSVEVVFEFKASAEILHLRFVKGIYLVCVEANGAVSVLSLHTKAVLASYLAPGAVCAVESDPALDWLVLGLQNGQIYFYDVDRFHLTPFRVDNLQKQVLPKHKLSPVRSLQWHPRDVGTLLATYSHCAVQYSLTNGAIKNAFVYQLTPECRGFAYSNDCETGGKKKLFGLAKAVVPLVSQTLYHPNGLHVVSVLCDGTLVFFDANDGTILEARTVAKKNLHLPGPPESLEPCGPISAKWLTGQDPELTCLVVSGASAAAPDILDVLHFGFTLKYSLASHEKQGNFYALPSEGQRKITVKFNRRLQERGGDEFISQILPLPADGQPYFSGCHNPASLLVLTNMGGVHLVELEPRTTQPKLPPSLATIMPPTTFSIVQTVRRVDWFGVIARRSGPPDTLLAGGAPVNRQYPRPLGGDEAFKDILISGHEDGTVRCLDVSAGDHHDEEQMFEFCVKSTLNNGQSSTSYRVSHVSFSFEARIGLVGLANGNVAIAKYGKLSFDTHSPPLNTDYIDCAVLHSVDDVLIVDLTRRIRGKFAQPSFIPSLMLLLPQPEKISCLNMSHTGFAAVGYTSGRLVVCDIARGPAVILNLASVAKHLPSVQGECYATTMEFAIMEYGQDGFSSLLLLVGTNAGGNFLCFKIVPTASGAFEAVFADKTLGLNYRSSDPGSSSCLDKIMPVNSATGESAVATLEMFQRLAQGILIPGIVAISSARDLRVLKVPKQKLSHKVIDETCVCSGIVNFGKGAVLMSLTRSGFVKIFSLPALSDLADVKLPSDTYDRVKKALTGTAPSFVLRSGELSVGLSATEKLNVIVYDTTKNKAYKDKPTDILFNDTAIIPPRPSAGALLWAKGQTAYISTKDLTLLIAGPNRKPAKHPESELAYNISPEANPNQSYGGYSAAAKGKTEPAYAEPVRKSAQNQNPYAFGTLRFMQGLRDGLDSVEESVNTYANGLSESMTETVDSGKRSFYTLAVKSKFGI